MGPVHLGQTRTDKPHGLLSKTAQETRRSRNGSSGPTSVGVAGRSRGRASARAAAAVATASQRLQLAAIFVANKNIQVGPSALVSLVRVTQGADVADAYIADNTA